ncbi:hypothetical protein D3C78_1013570 [compost metagenome]
MKAETGEVAEQDHQDPDKGEQAIFELPHQAGKDDLGNEGDAGADDAHRKCNQRHALRTGNLISAGKKDGDFRYQRRKLRAQACG